MEIALVNTNRIRPPIAPIGLEYVAESLDADGFEVSVLDLCWCEDPKEAIREFFMESDAGLVGVTLRNTDDCGLLSRQDFLPEFSDFVREIRLYSEANIIVGGIGFSVMPLEVLRSSGADAGVFRDGELALAGIAHKIESREDWRETPGVVYLEGDDWKFDLHIDLSLENLPPMKRMWFDNPRYFREGGQAGFESRRGCSGLCTYCPEPEAKGRRIRTPLPSHVVDELECLLAQGIDHFHTCDSEFNLPPDYAEELCREMTKRGIGERSRWYAYCTPAGFTKPLAEAMRRAGCVGINFGVDHGNEGMLRRLRRGFTPEDICNAAKWCREQGIVTMFDLLLGSPGESREALEETIALMKQIEPDRVGVSVGVRIYPGTALFERFENGDIQQGLTGGPYPEKPLFYLEPSVRDSIYSLLSNRIGDDPRFLFFDPTRGDRNYNYNANERLIKAIEEGYRGAYWDILRRLDENE